ncbi:hypothetical protein GOB48_19410 [Sinorhizobium meliloti]|nr:hypothetical protein [Sinorhizobium meliloti]
MSSVCGSGASTAAKLIDGRALRFVTQRLNDWAFMRDDGGSSRRKTEAKADFVAIYVHNER